MLETGQPLHAYDADKLESGEGGKKIIVRRAKKGEKITTLDNEKYDLDKNVLVIADEKNPVCLAGIKGGRGPGIDGQTKKIVLEAANFSPQIIRQGSKQLPNEVRPKKIRLNLDKVKNLLGVNIPKKEIIRILESLSFKIQNSKFKILYIVIPTRRIDVSIPEDLIEEIGRIYGFEKVPSQLPKATLIPPERNEDLVYQSKVRDILVNLGFSEVYNYSFVGDNGEIEVLNPVSQEQKYLRSNLASNLLENIRENRKYFKEVRLFEIGKVFAKEKGQVIEKKKLGLVLLPADFYRLKGIAETLLNKLRITDVWYDEASGKNVRAEVKAGNDLLGWLDDNIFELDFEKIVELATEERIYLPPSKYPAVVRDVALLVDRGTKVVEVLNLINAAGGSLVRDVDLFDMYEGEQIPDGKKNLAFHIIYQSDDHTLTDKEVNLLQEKIVKALEEEGGWEVRK